MSEAAVSILSKMSVQKQLEEYSNNSSGQP